MVVSDPTSLRTDGNMSEQDGDQSHLQEHIDMSLLTGVWCIALFKANFTVQAKPISAKTGGLLAKRLPLSLTNFTKFGK